jgi:hypothetical protein
MAAVLNVFTIQFSVNVLNGSYKERIDPGSLIVSQQAPGRGGGIETVAFASAGALSLGSITSNGWCFLQNLDAANFVTYGPQIAGGAMQAFGKLLAGEYAFVRISPGVVIMAQADTANVLLDVRIFQA